MKQKKKLTAREIIEAARQLRENIAPKLNGDYLVLPIKERRRIAAIIKRFTNK